MIKTLFPALIAISGLMTACCSSDETPDVTGMQPVYISYNDLLQFAQLPAQPIVEAGKIMVYNDYLFLGEVNKGVHVIDISDSLNPVKLSFLKIPGNRDISAQNDRLYVDNGPHFLILNIENINTVTVVQRKLNYFQPSEFFPVNYSGPFECADYSKGWLIEWESRSLSEPKCNR